MFFAVVPILLLLLALVFAGSAKAGWARVVQARRRPAPPLEALDNHDNPDDAAAVRAHLSGPPSAGETCDRCAVAAVAAIYLRGGRLLLCGHHGRQHQRVLHTQGALILGELSFPERSAATARRPT